MAPRPLPAAAYQGASGSTATMAASASTSGATLTAVQQPLATFHKDEGGKANALTFRFVLNGQVPLEAADAKGEIPLDVHACFEDTGEPLDPELEEKMLDVRGGTEKPNSAPHLNAVTKLGGVIYRLNIVSKRVHDRKICIQVALRGARHIAPLRSDGTLVFSKRKDVDARKEEQAKERAALEARERNAALALQAQQQLATAVSLSLIHI